MHFREYRRNDTANNKNAMANVRRSVGINTRFMSLWDRYAFIDHKFSTIILVYLQIAHLHASRTPEASAIAEVVV